MGRLVTASVIFMSLAAGAASAATSAAPPASVSLSGATGNILLAGPSGKNSKLAVGTPVKVGSRVIIPRSGNVTFAYPDGCTLTFDKRGTITVPAMCDAKTAAAVGAGLGGSAAAGLGAAGLGGAAAIGTGGMIAAGVIGVAAVGTVIGVAASDSGGSSTVSP